MQLAVCSGILSATAWQQSAVPVCAEYDGQDVKGRDSNVPDQLCKCVHYVDRGGFRDVSFKHTRIFVKSAVMQDYWA